MWTQKWLCATSYFVIKFLNRAVFLMKTSIFIATLFSMEFQIIKIELFVRKS